MFDILPIEDNAGFRSAIEEILRTHLPMIGNSSAGDPNEALRKLEQLRPGLVSMDIQSPEENGLVVTRKIQLLYEDIVVDILTSCSVSEYHQKIA